MVSKEFSQLSLEVVATVAGALALRMAVKGKTTVDRFAAGLSRSVNLKGAGE
jgi:hypothetical protein